LGKKNSKGEEERSQLVRVYLNREGRKREGGACSHVLEKKTECGRGKREGEWWPYRTRAGIKGKGEKKKTTAGLFLHSVNGEGGNKEVTIHSWGRGGEKVKPLQIRDAIW